MKWVALAGVLLYLARGGGAAVVKCSSMSQDPLCASEKRETSPPQEQSRDTECQAGTEWESNCHYCRCSDSGVAECLKQSFCDLDIFEEPIRCKPETHFHRDCNTCMCLENGLALCTLKGCTELSVPIERKRRQAASDGENECEPGTHWQVECNTCRCLSNGRAACTKRGCLGAFQKRDTSSVSVSESHMISKRATVCKANQEFQIDCNPCKCAANGQSYTCTHNECLEGGNTNQEVEVFMESEGSDHIERHSVCKPRDTFYIGCNPCHCNAYGTDYSCTNKPCPLPKDVEIFHELNIKARKPTNSTKQVVCVANRMFIMDCNTCWCNEDGTSFFCTRRVCTPDIEENSTDQPEFTEMKLKEGKTECRPNEVFELDCNMCRCNADGKSYSCTRRACVEDKNATVTRKTRAVQAEPPKTCQPGTEFRMDCNKCLCNDEGRDFSCTRIDCTAQNGNGEDTFAGARSKREIEAASTTATVEMKCEPGSVFDRECNVCRCTEEGLHAVCTLKRCKDKAEPSTEAAPSFRCTPGDQFKRECNDCTCAADGKTVFCTLRLCDEELTDI